jgi:hypothetical protein
MPHNLEGEGHHHSLHGGDMPAILVVDTEIPVKGKVGVLPIIYTLFLQNTLKLHK